MDDLLRHIDELADRGDRGWKRRGKQVRIRLSSGGRWHVVHVARKKDRYVFWSVVADAHAARQDRRALARRIWRRNARKPVVIEIVRALPDTEIRIERPVAARGRQCDVHHRLARPHARGSSRYAHRQFEFRYTAR